MEGAAARRKAILVQQSLGTGFPTLGVHVSGEDVMAGGLAGGSFRRSRFVGKLKGAHAEILPGRHIDDGEKWGMRLLTGATPVALETVFITFADDSYFERKLALNTSRKARDEVKRFNALAAMGTQPS